MHFRRELDSSRFWKNPLTHGRKVIGFTGVEVEGFRVRLDREAFRSPAIQAALKKFDPQESHGESSMQDGAASLITRASTVNDQKLSL
jgi:hypothetical protein